MKKISGAAALKIILTLLVAWALCANVVSSWKRYSQLPMTDPASYPALAENSSFFYDSGDREPVPVFLTKLCLNAGMTHDIAPRAASSAAALFAALLLVFCAWRRFGPVAAIAGGLIFSLNPYLGFYAATGANSIAAGLFLMLFCFAISDGEPSWKTALKAGIVGALAALTRLENLATVPLLAAAAGLAAIAKTGDRRTFLRKKAGYYIAAAGIAIILTAPYLAYQKAKYGNMMHSHKVHARFWLNTAAGVGPFENRYRGGEASVAELTSDGNSLLSFNNAVKGYRSAITGYIPKMIHSKTDLLPLLAGLIFAVIWGEWTFIAAAPILILPVVFILNLDQHFPGSGVEMRFLIHILWLTSLYAGMGAAGAWHYLGRIYARQKKQISAQ